MQQGGGVSYLYTVLTAEEYCNAMGTSIIRSQQCGAEHHFVSVDGVDHLIKQFFKKYKEVVVLEMAISGIQQPLQLSSDKKCHSSCQHLPLQNRVETAWINSALGRAVPESAVKFGKLAEFFKKKS